jgi:V-type H+-transporting ATPase proteolipid subunit
MGTWKAGQSVIYTGIRHPSSVMKNVIPIVMAGGKLHIYISSWCLRLCLSFIPLISALLSSLLVIGIYGLIVGVIIGQSITKPSNDRENAYSTYTGMAHLCAGLCCGFSGLAAGLCIGIVGDYGVRAVGYRASSVTLFPASQTEREGYSNIPDGEEGAEATVDAVSGSEDQNKLFIGMLIMLIFSEALAL